MRNTCGANSMVRRKFQLKKWNSWHVVTISVHAKWWLFMFKTSKGKSALSFRGSVLQTFYIVRRQVWGICLYTGAQMLEQTIKTSPLQAQSYICTGAHVRLPSAGSSRQDHLCYGHLAAYICLMTIRVRRFVSSNNPESVTTSQRDGLTRDGGTWAHSLPSGSKCSQSSCRCDACKQLCLCVGLLF